MKCNVVIVLALAWALSGCSLGLGGADEQAPKADEPETAAEPPSEGAPAAGGDPIKVTHIDPVAPTVAPVAVAASRIESKPQSTVLERFTTLARLRDAGLISPAEYAERRGANLGALMPLTGPAPSAALTRPAPPAEDVIGRLRTIGAFRAAGALSDAEFAAERIAILDALMPATGGGAPFVAPAPGIAATPTRGRTPVDDLIERTAMMEMAGPATPPQFLVIRLQNALMAIDYDPGPIDGIMGPKTRRAIRAFQTARGLPVTGKQTSELLHELEQAGAD